MTAEHEPRVLAFLDRIYAEPDRRFAFRGDDATDVATWEQAARPELRRLIGLEVIGRPPADFEPSVTLSDAEDLGDYTRRRGVLNAEPDVAVPFWFLLPSSEGPHQLGLFPHGHYGRNGLDYAAGIAADERMRARIVREDRDVAVQAVRRGYAAIAPATRGFAPLDIPDINKRHGERDCRSAFLHALLAGRTLTGERVWDLQRLLDWALRRPDIDPSGAFAVGNSAGGIVAIYAAACDGRIVAAVTSCCVCTFVGRSGAIHHCDCDAVPGIMGFGELHDVAGLIAPRPLLVVHGRTDPLFPPSEIDRAVTGLRHIYAAAGASRALRHAWGDGGHRFYGDLMWPFLKQSLP